MALEITDASWAIQEALKQKIETDLRHTTEVLLSPVRTALIFDFAVCACRMCFLIRVACFLQTGGCVQFIPICTYVFVAIVNSIGARIRWLRGANLTSGFVSPLCCGFGLCPSRFPPFPPFLRFWSWCCGVRVVFISSSFGVSVSLNLLLSGSVTGNNFRSTILPPGA